MAIILLKYCIIEITGRRRLLWRAILYRRHLFTESLPGSSHHLMVDAAPKHVGAKRDADGQHVARDFGPYQERHQSPIDISLHNKAKNIGAI
jgi:hypothetical protein